MVLIGEPMKSVQSAAFSILVPAGCCFDPIERHGQATLCCDMMLRGAGDRDSRAFINDLENLGVDGHESVGVSQASFGAATLSDNLPAALDIYADLLRRPHLPADQLEASRAVCLGELRAVEDEPAQKLMIELRRRRYPDPWGRSSHGEVETLSAIGIDDIREFHANRYQPDGAIIAVAGSFDWDALLGQIERLFGDWEPSNGKSTSTSNDKPTSQPDSSHLSHDSSQCHIGIAYPSIPYRHPDYFRAWAAIGVLSSGMSSRLFTEVREKRGLCYTVSASLHTQRDRASVLCYAGTSSERAQETLDVTYDELIRLSQGIEQAELDRLKARIKSALIMQQESTSSRSGSIARDWYHLGRVRSLEEVSKIVDDLTADSINDFLTANPPEDFTFLTLGPQPLELPHAVS